MLRCRRTPQVSLEVTFHAQVVSVVPSDVSPLDGENLDQPSIRLSISCRLVCSIIVDDLLPDINILGFWASARRLDDLCR